MSDTVTIPRQKYEQLRREAAAWRRVIGDADQTVVFNAVRDNGGEGVEAGVLADKLREIMENDS